MVACTETHGMGRSSAGQVLDTEGVKAWRKRREVLQWGIPGRQQDLCWQQGAEQAHTAATTAAAVAQAWASAHRPGRVGRLGPAPGTEGTHDYRVQQAQAFKSGYRP